MTTTVGARTMRALAKTRPEPGAELIERQVPTPGPGEVLLKMVAASICGTDYHLYSWDTWASEIVKPPVVLGHELAGVVAEAGAGVTRVKEGDLVGVESHIVDWTCAQCRAGNMHLCRNLRVIGAHVDGGFAEYVVIPETNAIESNGLDPAVVALQEPMGTNRMYQPAAALPARPSSAGGRPARMGTGRKEIKTAIRQAIRLRCSATVMPKITRASSAIMKIPSNEKGARGEKSTKSMILGRSKPVMASRMKAHPNQRSTPSGVRSSSVVGGRLSVMRAC